MVVNSRRLGRTTVVGYSIKTDAQRIMLHVIGIIETLIVGPGTLMAFTIVEKGPINRQALRKTKSREKLLAQQQNNNNNMGKRCCISSNVII